MPHRVQGAGLHSRRAAALLFRSVQGARVAPKDHVKVNEEALRVALQPALAPFIDRRPGMLIDPDGVEASVVAFAAWAASMQLRLLQGDSDIVPTGIANWKP